MVNIPVKFKRMAAAFDEMARVRSYESSGSEHSAADLSDLVNSFFESEIREQKTTDDDQVIDRDENGDEINDDDESENNSPDFELEDSLKKLFDRDQNDVVRSSIHAEVEKALEDLGADNKSSPDFKRRLMARLRSDGFDAGLCKSKWEKNGRIPSGNYEYIDVINTGENRYIVEVFIEGEFTIARPTNRYTSLLNLFPRIFVGKPEELNQLVKLMCRAMRKSMKSVDLTLPPWRRPAYLKAKWLGPYKRTINEVRGGVAAAKELAGNRLVGFSACRLDFAAKSGGRIGGLAAVMSQKEMVR